jgi:hypothetical protein
LEITSAAARVVRSWRIQEVEMKVVRTSAANTVCLARRHTRVIACVTVVAAGAATMFLDVAGAQAHPAGQSAKPPAPGSSAGTHAHGTPAPTAAKVDANLLQLMRGILYPSSNVIFAAQDDLGKQPPVSDPSVSPNPLTSTYGGWQAVENAGLALAESANLIALPGRMCGNGKPVPGGLPDRCLP